MQIRVGRFDSGPSLQLSAVTAHVLAAFFRAHTFARFLDGSGVEPAHAAGRGAREALPCDVTKSS